MGRFILALAVALVAFAGGLVAMYQAMPRFDPDRVERTQQYLDSLALADTLVQMDSLQLALLEPPPVEIPDSLRTQMQARDALILALTDSLNQLRGAIQTSNDQIQELRGEVEALVQAWVEQEERRAEASQLSGTLTKLEDEELQMVLARLNLPLLEQLYIESSNRNRTRLLQSLAPERAARVVQVLMDAVPDDAADPLPAAAGPPTNAG
ncbi:MAG: hypothetical protein AAGI71_05085 [Bacteroidota bacterium]